MNSTPNPFTVLKYAILTVIALVLVFGSFGSIEAGERGVKTRLGEVKGTYEPGLYFKVPIIDRMNKLNIQTREVKYELEEPLYAASKDLQDVNISVLVTYHVDPTQVGTIYQQYKTVEAFEANTVRPAVRDIVKSMASQYTAEELVTKRAEYSTAVHKALTERLTTWSVALEQVNITNFEFSRSFSAAIEAKVTAEQEALTVKNQLERTRYEAEQKVIAATADGEARVINAEAEAEAIRIQAEAITSQGGADYVKLKAIEKWNGDVPSHMIPNATVPFIDLN